MYRNKQTIMVTGASSGIGRAICHQVIDTAEKVIGVARNINPSEINHAKFTAHKIDLSDLDGLAIQLDKLSRQFPEVSALICCAGRGQFGSLEEFSYNQIRSLFELNLIGQVYMAKAFIPLMKARKRGNIIFIGSEAALSGSRKGTIYCATKFALRGFAQALREECAHSGVHVSIVNPGMTKTAFFDDLDFAPGDAPDQYIEPQDIAIAVDTILNARHGTVYDEINLSPLKKVVQKKPK